ncbi:MAG: type VII secretion protein EccE, partial [Phycicoccus sp.]
APHLLAAATRDSLLLDGTARLVGHGVVVHRGRWSAALRVEPTDRRLAGPRSSAHVPVGALADAVADLPAGAVAVRQVVQSVPGAVGRASTGESDGPVRRRTWLVILVDPARAPQAVTQRGGGDLAVMRLLARTASRLTADCAAHGLAVEPVGRPTLHHLVVDLSAPAETQDGPSTGGVREAWRGVVDGVVLHRCVELTGGASDAASTTSALEALCRLVADQVIAVTEVVRDRSDRVAVRVVLRLTGSPHQIAAATAAVPLIAERHGVRLRMLDGLHGPALLTTLPVGRR